MQKLLIATKNKGKFGEISEGFSGLGFELIFLGDLKIDNDNFVEGGETFEENAYKKAKFYYDKTGLMTFAEDSGIVVDALKGELGVKTRRWGLGEAIDDESWVNYFLERMRNVGNGKRWAKFICCAYLLDEKNNISVSFKGETKGRITRELLAPIKQGLPLSSCFLPEGCNKVYAALSMKEKNMISHRGKALVLARAFLENLFNAER